MNNFYDKVKYEAYHTEWALSPVFTFYASVVASADEIRRGVLQNTESYIEDVVVKRVNTSATQPHFFVYLTDDDDAEILYRVYPE